MPRMGNDSDMATADIAAPLNTLSRAVDALSACRSLPEIADIVRRAAREMVGADGITVVLREDRMVRYVDEDAVAPLWKGSAFPIASCISGLAMLARETIVIDDIYADARVPHDLYAKTFVKSMAMAPVRKSDPVASIGAYWATKRMPTAAEIAALEAMAQATSVAIEVIGLREALAQLSGTQEAPHNLAAVTARLDVLRRTPLNETQARMVDALADAAAKVERMILGDARPA